MSSPTDSAAARRTWNRTPVGSQRSRSEPGTLEYFDDLRAYRYGYETPFLESFFRYSELRGRRVLEIGIGNGMDAVEMARAGAQYTGIDVTERHIELTRRHFELRGLPRPEVIHGKLLEHDFAEPFDVAYSFGVLHHIPQEAEYLRRIHQVLRPGGRLLAGFYSRYSSFNAYLLTSWLLKAPRGTPYDDWRSHVAELSPLGDPVTIRIRSRRAIQRLAEQAGFEVVRYAKRGFTQGHLPLLGKFCAPSGPVLSMLGAVLGWYHLFEFRKVS
jgi:2-polyprenyl-3-methyl-5-hydroxy-6-metoxy-1,4-benzoquinol methylase